MPQTSTLKTDPTLKINLESNSKFRFEDATKINDKWFGIVEIGKTSKAQSAILESKNSNEIHIFGCEHYEVLSAGKSLWKSDLTHYSQFFKNIDLTLRGGQLTLHNPGQLIIYPILNLKSVNLNLRTYIQFLLSVSQNTFLQLGLKCEVNTDSNIGIYSSEKKILSLGLHHSGGWVSHGLSINVNNELTKFSLFDVCGLSTTQVTSLNNLKINISTKHLFSIWLAQFKTQLFNHMTLSQQIKP